MVGSNIQGILKVELILQEYKLGTEEFTFYYNTLKELEDLVNENKLEVWQVIATV